MLQPLGYLSRSPQHPCSLETDLGERKPVSVSYKYPEYLVQFEAISPFTICNPTDICDTSYVGDNTDACYVTTVTDVCTNRYLCDILPITYVTDKPAPYYK